MRVNDNVLPRATASPLGQEIHSKEVNTRIDAFESGKLKSNFHNLSNRALNNKKLKLSLAQEMCL